MQEQEFAPQGSSLDNADNATPRCLGCGYPLTGLDQRRCPECGQKFDPADPATFSRKPPFLFWTYWLPGVAIAFLGGFVVLLVFGLSGEIGIGATFGIPVAVGGILGYGVRGRITAILILSLVVGASFIATILMMHPAALLCGLFLFGIFAIPLGAGVFVGFLLRLHLKYNTRFSQRSYLPMLLFLLLPLGLDQVERRWVPPPTAEEVSTTVELPMSSAEAWDRLMFYEEVPHDRPLLLRLGLATPRYTTGQAAQVGDVKICVYTHGRLAKRVTHIEPGRVLAFDVIQQHRVESHSVRLLPGSFRFEPSGPGSTRVTLTTRYVPLLTPRFCWRPVERLCAGTLHRHVLEGMRREADEPDPLAQQAARP